MTTAYTPILKLALPVTGELNGTWGNVVNDNITSMVEQAVAGLATINTWTANSHTLTTADGTTSESRCAMLVIDDDGAGNPSAAATVICPTATKAYIVQNLCGQTVTVKTAAGTGVAIPNNQAALVFCDGTNVVTGAFNGDVVGPATSTNNAIVTFDGTTGKLIKDNSGATISAGVITATGFSGPLNGTVGATTPSTVVATQVDITAQGDLRLQDTTGGQYVALQAPGTIATSYTLTLPVDDGTAGQALVTDGSGVLSWSSAASGDVYGPASATDNAVARYDGTTGKIIQNSAVTIGDDGATVIAANSASDGLRITQLGTGNALTVEDAANPDATPVVIDNSGNVVIGHTTAIPAYGFNNQLEVLGGGNAYQLNAAFRADAFAPLLSIGHSRNATIGSHTVLQNNDIFGGLAFVGSDGTQFIRGAEVSGAVDGTPGTNDMPGRLVFSTTADGASSPTERMRITSSGTVGISGSPTAGTTFQMARTITGSTVAWNFYNLGTIQSDVTNQAKMYVSVPSTAAAAFTLGSLAHFNAQGGTVGAGSTITNQYGFEVSSNLTGATNNYGFHSNIASGTGRWNFYANGTADNYFAGALGLGSVAIAGVVPLNIGYNLTGGTSVVNVRAIPTILSDVTSSAAIFRTQPFVQNAAFTLASLTHYYATQGSFGALSTVANQYGFFADAGLTGATNNYGFLGNIASGTGRWNFYAAGTAANYFGGIVQVSAPAGNTSPLLELSGNNNASGATNTLRFTDGDGSSASNQQLGKIEFYSADATTGEVKAYIGSFSEGLDPSAYLSFATAGATTPTERGRISSTGVWSLGAAPGAESLRVTPVASAVNYLEVLGNITSNSPALLSSGSDTNLNMFFVSKGTGNFDYFTGGTSGVSGVVRQFRISHTASAVNYLQVTGGDGTTTSPRFSAQGSSTDVTIQFQSKGTGELQFFTNSVTRQFNIAHVASAVNYLQVAGAATGNGATLSAAGSDSNIDIKLTPKGTGVLAFGTYTAGIIAQAGSITIKDAAGNTRRLLVG